MSRVSVWTISVPCSLKLQVRATARERGCPLSVTKEMLASSVSPALLPVPLAVSLLEQLVRNEAKTMRHASQERATAPIINIFQDVTPKHPKKDLFDEKGTAAVPRRTLLDIEIIWPPLHGVPVGIPRGIRGRETCLPVRWRVSFRGGSGFLRGPFQSLPWRGCR